MDTETAAATRTTKRRGRRIAQALAVPLVLGVFTGIGFTRASASETVDECVRRRVASGESRSVALAACLATDDTTPGDGPGSNNTDGNDGTSTGLLIVVGLGGIAVGAAAATMLRRRGASSPASGPLAAAPASAVPPMSAPPVMSPPHVAAPPPAAAAGNTGLVSALIDLSDRVPSQALRAEILAALGRAGVHPIEPATGEVFDMARMRGVGSAPAPDGGWVGRVAAVERVGFHDGTTVLRLPEVVVYTAGS